jgi:hypothetical protein
MPSPEEEHVLKQIATAQGKTYEQLLQELGHLPASNADNEVTFTGSKSDALAEEPLPESAPVEEEIPLPPAAEEPETANEPETEDNEPLTLGSMRAVCVHCGWDQQKPTIPEPEYTEKMVFLQAILGQRLYTKTTMVFGGKLKITFRTLTVQEIDAMYQEAFRAQKAGIIVSASDYYEYLNRLRLHLQLTGLSASVGTLHITLPDGLDRSTNPDAKTVWEEFLPKKEGESGSLLEQIQAYILSHVLKTEQLQRIITRECNQFNQLVVKLEACVDDPNFWKETEQPS